MTTIENYQIRIFESPEFGKVRIMVDNDGNPLFCRKDVCEVLGYKRTDHAIRQHVNLNDVLKQDVSTPIVSQGRNTGMSKRMEMLFVNESGLNSISCYTTTQIAKEMGRKLIHKKVKNEE